MNKATVKALILGIILTFLIPVQGTALAATNGASQSLNITASSAILIDAQTGEVLWEKNADMRRPMASTTKMMTALLALEREELDDTVTVGAEVRDAGPYGIKLVEGEQLVFEDLLYALMLNSANDAALVVADHIGGSVDKFVRLMNKKATRIGAFDTHYANPHGLSDKMNYSTARDLAVIARYGMQNDDFKTIVATRDWRLHRVDPNKPALVENRNKLLGLYPNATGIKTGYINEAGFCLVSSAESDTASLVAVVLGASSYKTLFRESGRALDYGFSMYEKTKLIEKGRKYRTVTLKYGDELGLVASKDVEAYVRRSLETSTTVSLRGDIRYPIEKGKVLGSIKISRQGRELATADLVAARGLAKPGLGKMLRFYSDRFWKSLGV